MELDEYDMLRKYSIEEILEKKELPEDIKLLAEQERKKLEEKFKNNDFWKRLPKKLKYFGIAGVFTWEDYIEYRKSIWEINVKSIYPDTSHNCHSHGIVNTEGQSGVLDPSPNADWALARNTKAPRW